MDAEKRRVYVSRMPKQPSKKERKTNSRIDEINKLVNEIHEHGIKTGQHIPTICKLGFNTYAEKDAIPKDIKILVLWLLKQAVVMIPKRKNISTNQFEVNMNDMLLQPALLIISLLALDIGYLNTVEKYFRQVDLKNLIVEEILKQKKNNKYKSLINLYIEINNLLKTTKKMGNKTNLQDKTKMLEAKEENTPLSYLMLARCYYRLGDLDNSKRYYIKTKNEQDDALDKNDHECLTTILLRQSRKKQKLSKKEKKILTSCIATYKKSETIKSKSLRKEFLYYYTAREEKNSEARKLFLKLKESHENFTEEYISALSSEEENRNEQLKETYRKILKVYPIQDVVDRLINLINKEKQKSDGKKYDETHEIYRNAIENTESRQDKQYFLKKLANLTFAHKNYPGTIRCYKQLLAPYSEKTTFTTKEIKQKNSLLKKIDFLQNEYLKRKNKRSNILDPSTPVEKTFAEKVLKRPEDPSEANADLIGYYNKQK
jgi:hypothetical protein